VGPFEQSAAVWSAAHRGAALASRRGGADLVALEGGRLHNRWDRPLAARDRPFDFDGVGGVTTVDRRKRWPASNSGQRIARS
jgi:hypothetical protein